MCFYLFYFIFYFLFTSNWIGGNEHGAKDEEGDGLGKCSHVQDAEASGTGGDGYEDRLEPVIDLGPPPDGLEVREDDTAPQNDVHTDQNACERRTEKMCRITMWFFKNFY